MNMKYALGKVGDAPVKELLGVDTVEVETNERGSKAIISFEAEKKGDKIAFKFNDNLSAVVTVVVSNIEGYDLLTLKTYSIKSSNGDKFSFDSIYELSLNSIAYRIFAKAIAPFKAKYAPVRNSMAAETKAKLRAELEAYRAARKGKVEVAAEDVEEDSDY